jgi:hypothetical protein
MPLPANIPQCRHIKTKGMRCGSPAVRSHYYCYYHAQIHQHQRRHSSAEARELPLQLPPLEDAHSIQLALMEIGHAILNDRISDKKAGLLLYMVQTASINLKRLEEDCSEELVRQDYPEAVEQMQQLKREAARDPEEQRQETLTDILLKGLGIHPDQPIPPPVPPDETPTWWEIQCGYKQPLPDQTPDSPLRPQTPQSAQRGTEQNPPAQRTQTRQPDLEENILPGKIPDIHGMADRSNNQDKLYDSNRRGRHRRLN